MSILRQLSELCSRASTVSRLREGVTPVQHRIPGRRFAAVSALALILAGCSNPSPFLSESGPTREAVVEGAQFHPKLVNDVPTPYALVPLTDEAVKIVASKDVSAGFSSVTTRVGAASGKIGPGDQLSVTIFEADSGGLFMPKDAGARPGNFVAIPVQQVDAAGNITIPYAGVVHAAGESAQSVQQAIQGRLSSRALEPQVVVTIVNRGTDAVSVLGDVYTSTRFSLDPGGSRLLEAVARAGGPRYPAYETMVTLQRHGRASKALLSLVAQDPKQNIQLQPGDVVFLSHEQRFFVALGAVGQSSSLGQVNRRFAFEDTELTLADAIGKAGGLNDDRAHAQAIFVYRTEPRSTLTALGIPSDAPAQVPTIYSVDLSDPSGYFRASKFYMRDRDILFVSNSPSSDLTKLLNIVLPGTESAANIRTATQ
ncbi:polysaccharide biosynthesis/export family protein [Methylovirgula sp. 4M-Z18]|uniref:polysaccharide biosynthesis/export family protein n=1 Tax=Methylovirgula sp. 4M-Z18 TaxID=2293567 RepID=UPI000E2F12E4|nr:polysaccharide biosynthesis/export family protein [Methylovirgula sp. 4M-Z18]RFB75515.1 polysaccharide export protein [Methylovirgula sp. 4M-Z18]